METSGISQFTVPLIAEKARDVELTHVGPMSLAFVVREESL